MTNTKSRYAKSKMLGKIVCNGNKGLARKKAEPRGPNLDQESRQASQAMERILGYGVTFKRSFRSSSPSI